MKCLFPYIRSKTGGPDGSPVIVPCGRCIACRINKATEWSLRIQHESITSKYPAVFVTLTYNEENVPYVDDRQVVYKPDLQRFINTLRKFCERRDYPSPRYFFGSEYGPTTLRPHYHGIIFNLHPDVVPELARLWNKGFITCSSLTKARSLYCAKYFVSRSTDKTDDFRPFSLMSKNPGIGADYCDAITEQTRYYNRDFCYIKGNKAPLPVYYKRRIWTDEERKQINEDLYRMHKMSIEELHSLIASDDPVALNQILIDKSKKKHKSYNI